MKVVGVRGKMKQDFYFLLKTLVYLGGVTQSRIKRVSALRRNIVHSVAAAWTNNSLACQLYSSTLVGGRGEGRGERQQRQEVEPKTLGCFPLLRRLPSQKDFVEEVHAGLYGL